MTAPADRAGKLKMRQLKFRVWDKVEKRFIEGWNPDPKLSWDGTIYCYERRMKDGKYLADELRKKAYKLRQDGYSYRQIAKMLGVKHPESAKQLVVTWFNILIAYKRLEIGKNKL